MVELLKKLARSGGSGISTPIVVIKDDILDIETVHVNSVNNVHNHGIKSLNCLYVNARSLVNNLKIDELKAYVVEFDLDIIGITETWSNEGIWNSEISIDNFSIYRKDRSEVKGACAGGVIVYVRDSVISFPCEELNKYNTESVWCKVVGDKGNVLTFGVCYKSPNAEDSEVNELKGYN